MGAKRLPCILVLPRSPLIAIVLLLGSGAPLRAASIFDEDWTPPKRTAPEPLLTPATRPVTPTPNGAISAPTVAAVPSPTGIGQPALTGPISARSGRLPVPSSADQARSRKLLREVFAKELADHTAQGRTRLAERLLTEAKKAIDNSTDQFVLAAGAIQAASEAGDLPLCFRAADAMAQAYDVDALTIKAQAAVGLKYSAASTTQAVPNVVYGLQLTDDLVSAEQVHTAARVCAVLQGAGVRSANLRATVQQTARDVSALCAAYDRAAESAEKLKQSPNDPAANQVVGNYLCFVKGQWQAGLPLLVKSAIPTVAGAASRDLAAPTDATGEVAVGDAWWDAAEKDVANAAAIRRRAAVWYRKSLDSGQVTGLSRMRLEKRITEAELASRQKEVLVEALIDGNSELHLTPNGLYWKQLPGSSSKPGRHFRNNLPTYVNHRPWMPEWGRPEKDTDADESKPLPLNLEGIGFGVEVLAVGGDDNVATPDGIRGVERRDPVTIQDRGGEQTISIPDTQVGAKWYRLRMYRRGAQ